MGFMKYTLRCHDIYTNFHKDLFSHSKVNVGCGLIHVQAHTLTDSNMVSVSVLLIFNKENRVKMDRKGAGRKCAGIGGCCEHDNEPSGPIMGEGDLFTKRRAINFSRGI